MGRGIDWSVLPVSNESYKLIQIWKQHVINEFMTSVNVKHRGLGHKLGEIFAMLSVSDLSTEEWCVCVKVSVVAASFE